MRLGVVTDVHLAPPSTPNVRCHGLMRPDEAEARLEQALAYMLERDVNAIAVPGDHSHFGDHESLTKTLALLAATALPVYVVCGNHDLSRPRRT